MADISRTVKVPRKSPKITPKTASFTVKYRESGSIFLLNSTTQIVATLPKIVKNVDGAEFTFVVNALDGGATGHSITPASGDSIRYAAAGGSVTASQSMIAAVAGDQIGQSVKLVADFATTSWIPVHTHGTWTKA